MSSALRDSLRGFLQGIPSSNSQTLLVEAIRKSTETAEWQSSVMRMSPRKQVAALRALASEAFESDLGNLRSNLLFNTRSVGPYIERSGQTNWLEQPTLSSCS
jgi:hypothetical protein